MYITPAYYANVFKEIKRTSLSHSTCKLIIFVSCLSIDSLCSAKILSNIFKKELIQYQLIPVVGYSDLKTHFANLDDDIANVLLIGCGAMLDLESFFQIDEAEYILEHQETDAQDDDDHINRQLKIRLKRRIYIIDGHRPWNLDNLFGSSMIVCFDDGYVDQRMSKEKDAYELLSQMDEEEELDSESASEENDTERDEDTDDDKNDRSQEQLPNSQESVHSNKRPLDTDGTKNLKKQRRAEISSSEDTVDIYYNQGTTISSSISASIYALLSKIGEATIDNLWLSIIGTSSLDCYYPEVYDRIQPLYKDEVLRLSPSTNNEKTADSTTLDIIKDYHLFLLRHWNLYDSFLYSSQVNAKLNLWTEEGKKKLHKLFAKMGVSLAIAQQKWLYMDIGIKQKLPHIFNKYLPLYGLEGIVRDGFVRTYGFMGQLSAMETVESLTALLELDRGILGNDTLFSKDELQEVEDQDEQINSEIEKKEKAWVSNFWTSWDALSKGSSTSTATNNKKAKGLTLLLKGLEQAKSIQQIIFKTGMSVLERKLVKNLRLYRLCVLNQGSVPDLEIFSNPLMLSKLGSWLLDNISEIDFVNKNNTLRPLIVASLNVVTDVYLVIGLVPKYPRGAAELLKDKSKNEKNEGKFSDMTTRLNTFSVAFQQVASTSGAKVRIDSFDSSVIEIRREDLLPFLEKLTLSGLL